MYLWLIQAHPIELGRAPLHRVLPIAARIDVVSIPTVYLHRELIFPVHPSLSKARTRGGRAEKRIPRYPLTTIDRTRAIAPHSGPRILVPPALAALPEIPQPVGHGRRHAVVVVGVVRPAGLRVRRRRVLADEGAAGVRAAEGGDAREAAGGVVRDGGHAAAAGEGGEGEGENGEEEEGEEEEEGHFWMVWPLVGVRRKGWVVGR